MFFFYVMKKNLNTLILPDNFIYLKCALTPCLFLQTVRYDKWYEKGEYLTITILVMHGSHSHVYAMVDIYYLEIW